MAKNPTESEWAAVRAQSDQNWAEIALYREELKRIASDSQPLTDGDRTLVKAICHMVLGDIELRYHEANNVDC